MAHLSDSQRAVYIESLQHGLLVDILAAEVNGAPRAELASLRLYALHDVLLIADLGHLVVTRISQEQK